VAHHLSEPSGVTAIATGGDQLRLEWVKGGRVFEEVAVSRTKGGERAVGALLIDGEKECHRQEKR
jgi:hypothetical protein